MENIQKEYGLNQNYPNPFNPATQISYTLPVSEQTTVTVYDMLGKVVQVLVDGYRTAGTHAVTFDAGRLSSGIYFYELQTPSHRETKKMLLMQ